jgi:hypothetical protein
MSNIFDRLASEESGNIFDRVKTIDSKPKNIFDRISQQQEVKQEPSLGDIGKGLTAEIAIGESAKLAGTTAGAAVAGPIGALVGYLAGGVGGGISGSLTAQRIEGRDKYSWGRVAADTLLNIIPFAGGKAAKTTKIFPKLGKRALTGAGISAGAAQIEKGIEEQEFLSPTELLVAGATGGALNIGIGAASDALGDIYRKKIAGKSVDEVQKAYDEGDADYVALIDAVTKEGDPEGKFDRFIKSVSSYALPTRVIGNKASADIRDAMSKSEAAMDLATRARKQIDSVYKDLDDEGKKAVDKYILGETKQLGVTQRVAPESVNVFHSTDVEFDTFRDRDIGFHFAANADLADNAAKLTGKEGATAKPFNINTTDFIEISDQGNRFDPYDIVEELNTSGRLSNERADSIMDGLADIEDRMDLFDEQKLRNLQGEYFSKAMKDEGIRGFKYMNVYDAYGEASRFMDNPEVMKQLKAQGVQPDFSYIVLDNADIQKGHRAAPKPLKEKDVKSLTRIKSTIDSARSKLDEYQDTVIDLYDKGVLDMNELTYRKIVDSRKRGDYLTTEYRFFLDDSYVPTNEQTQALMKRLTDDARNQFIQKAGKRKSKEMLGKVDELQPFFERRAADKVRRLLDLRDDPEAINDILKRKELQSEEMKDYLGIITEPGERFFGTISKLGKLAAVKDGERKLTERFVRSGVGEVADSEADIKRLTDAGYELLRIRGKAQNKFGRERATRAVDKYEDNVTKEIYNTKEEAISQGVNPSDLKHITSETYLRGGSSVYVPREVNQAVDLLSRKTFKEDSILWSENLFTQLLSTTTAASKFVKVPLSVAAYPVQFVGNAVMVGGMGMNPFKNYSKNFKIATSDLNTKYFREGGFAKDLTPKRMTRLKELNLIDKGISAGEIREGLSKGFFGKQFGKITEPTGKFYSIFDTAQRLSVFDNYKGFLRKNMSNEDFTRLGNDKIEEMAAELTNATYQNYSRINPAIRYFSRIGALNEFAAFNLEQMRTMANQATFIRDLKSGKFADDIKAEYGVDLDRGSLAQEGNKRIGFLLATLAGATAAVTAVNRGFQGVSSDEEKAIRETVVPTWDEDSKLLLRKDGDKIKTANISYQIPIAELTSIVESGLRGENPVDAVGQGFGALWNKMGGSGTMNANNFFAALNNRDPRTGRPISDEPGGLGQFTDRFVYYFGESFTPTLLGKTSDKTMPDLIARYTLGLRNQNTTVEGGAGFKLRALRDNFNNIRRSYSSDLYRNLDMQDSYQARNAVFQRNLAEVIKHANNLRTLGKTDEETNKILAKSGLSKAVREAALENEMINMPIAVGISGSREDRKKRLVELYDKLPPNLGMLMLNEARDDGKVKQSTINEILRQSQFQKLGQ